MIIIPPLESISCDWPGEVTARRMLNIYLYPLSRISRSPTRRLANKIFHDMVRDTMMHDNKINSQKNNPQLFTADAALIDE